MTGASRPGWSRRRVLGAAAVGAVGAVGAATGRATAATGLPQGPDPAPASAAASDSLFGRFSGTCQGGTSQAALAALGLGWDRQDASWAAIQPAAGVWDDTALDQVAARAAAAAAAGIGFLPMLGYTAPWAARRDPYGFDHQDHRVEIGPVLAETATTFTRHVTETAADGSVVVDEDRVLSRDKTPPRDPAEWASFVDRVVARLGDAGVEWFQPWNEAWWGSGFWLGGLDDYLASVHLPAAAAVHARGGKVVYGGWPAMAPTAALVALLDDHGAWSSIDALDVHYRAVNALPGLLATMVDRLGAGRVWQSEFGFSSAVTTIPNLWPRVFSWALSQGLATRPDLVAMFWFAWWSPDDPSAYGYGKCLRSGTAASGHGRAFAGLAALLDAPAVSRFSSFTTQPGYGFTLDGAVSSAEGFALPSGRRVICLHAKQPPATVTVTVPGLTGADTVERVDIFGNRTPVAVTGTTIAVPSADPDPEAESVNAASTLRHFNLVIG